MSGNVDMSAWTRFLEGAVARTKDLTPVHVQIGEYLQGESRANFISQGGAKRWPELAQSTLTPARLKYGRYPLMKTRALMASMTYSAEREYCDVGSNAVQARAQFYGVDGKIPARSPFNWRAGVMDAVGDMYTQFIFRGR